MARVYLEYLGDAVELPLGETVIGRDLGCTLRFNDPSVSRRHMKLVRRSDDVFVEDLGSSNGTLLNGRAVRAPARVAHGDLLLLGTREVTIQIPDADAEEPETVTLVPAELGIPLAAAAARVTTSRLPATMPPPSLRAQRCPRCGAAVSAEDDECASCHYAWSNFRPAVPTQIGVSPLHRRRHARRPVELHLVYVSSDLEIEATTRDLSTSGVFVCTQVLEPLGTACELTILVDGGPPLRVRGIVRRVAEREETGLGIEFVGVGARELAWLETLIAGRRA